MKGILGSLAISAFLVTAAYADPAVPFSGVIVEGGVGLSRNDAKASDTNIELRSVDDGTLTYRTYNAADSKKQSDLMGRFSLGYGYMLPYHINLAIVGSYNPFQQLTSVSVLENVFDVRLQPGYFIAPARTLIYASVGYARASVSDSLGRADMSHAVFADGAVGGGARIVAPSNYPSSTAENTRAKTNGLVLGGGFKFSPVGKFYVGIDYSYIRYQKKTYTGSTRTATTATPFEAGFTPFDASWTRTVEPRSSNLLLTLGYYFF